MKDGVKKTLLAVLAAALGALAVSLPELGLPPAIATIVGAVVTAALAVVKPPGTPTDTMIDDAYAEGYAHGLEDGVGSEHVPVDDGD